MRKCVCIRRRALSGALRLFSVATLVAAGVFAQVNTGTILGTVTDTSGAAVADVLVQIRNVGTGVASSTTTDGQGRFNVPSLNIGDYEVSASKAGFQTMVRTGIALTVGSQFVVDLALAIGQAQQTITVQGEGAQVDTTTSTVANLVDAKQIAELPLNG